MTTITQSQNAQFKEKDNVVITEGVRKGLFGSVLENMNDGYYYVLVDHPKYNNKVKVVFKYSQLALAEGKQ